MPAKLAPSEVSRDKVQVVLRDSTSTSPDCSAVNRSLADSGTYFTLVGSLKIAAAMARQTSTSSPVQLPLSSSDEKAGRPWLTPHASMPRSLTVLSVSAWAPTFASIGARARVRARVTRFINTAFRGRAWGAMKPQRVGGPDLNPPVQTPYQPMEDGHAQRSRACMNERKSRQAPQRAAIELRQHHRTTGCPGQGVDCPLLHSVINDRSPARFVGLAGSNESRNANGIIERPRCGGATKRRDTADHGGTGHAGAARIRESPGRSRFDRSVPHGRGPARAPRGIPVWPPRHSDHQGSAAGAHGARRSAMCRRRDRAVGSRSDLYDLAVGAQVRRSPAGLRQHLSPDPQFLRRHARSLWCRNDLFRPIDRPRN